VALGEALGILDFETASEVSRLGGLLGGWLLAAPHTLRHCCLFATHRSTRRATHHHHHQQQQQQQQQQVAGSKFYYLKGAAALLELALINWAVSRVAAKVRKGLAASRVGKRAILSSRPRAVVAVALSLRHFSNHSGLQCAGNARLGADGGAREVRLPATHGKHTGVCASRHTPEHSVRGCWHHVLSDYLAPHRLLAGLQRGRQPAVLDRHCRSAAGRWVCWHSTGACSQSPSVADL
jgi:hypothetical protein